MLCRIYKKTGMASPTMAPPLADYDHFIDHDDLSSGGGAFDDATGFYTPSSNSSTTCRTMITHQQQQPHAGRLLTIPPISELFDDYALAQMFDTETEHLAVHPSLNQLLSVGDSAAHVEPSYYAPSSSSPAGSAEKRKAPSPEECAGVGHHSSEKRLKGSCFEAPPQTARGLQAASAVLSGLNHQMLPQF